MIPLPHFSKQSIKHRFSLNVQHRCLAITHLAKPTYNNNSLFPYISLCLHLIQIFYHHPHLPTAPLPPPLSTFHYYYFSIMMDAHTYSLTILCTTVNMEHINIQYCPPPFYGPMDKYIYMKMKCYPLPTSLSFQPFMNTISQF